MRFVSDQRFDGAVLRCKRLGNSPVVRQSQCSRHRARRIGFYDVSLFHLGCFKKMGALSHCARLSGTMSSGPCPTRCRRRQAWAATGPCGLRALLAETRPGYRDRHAVTRSLECSRVRTGNRLLSVPSGSVPSSRRSFARNVRHSPEASRLCVDQAVYARTVREALDCPSNCRRLIPRIHPLAHPTEPAFTTQVSGTGRPVVEGAFAPGLHDRYKAHEANTDE